MINYRHPVLKTMILLPLALYHFFLLNLFFFNYYFESYSLPLAAAFWQQLCFFFHLAVKEWCLLPIFFNGFKYLLYNLEMYFLYFTCFLLLHWKSMKVMKARKRRVNIKEIWATICVKQSSYVGLIIIEVMMSFCWRC